MYSMLGCFDVVLVKNLHISHWDFVLFFCRVPRQQYWIYWFDALLHLKYRIERSYKTKIPRVLNVYQFTKVVSTLLNAIVVVIVVCSLVPIAMTSSNFIWLLWLPYSPIWNTKLYYTKIAPMTMCVCVCFFQSTINIDNAEAEKTVDSHR